jgi:hypothetical protein
MIAALHVGYSKITACPPERHESVPKKLQIASEM